MEAQALKKRGWSISAIARHLGRDRKTVRGYLNGQREPGVRKSSRPDPIKPYTNYLKARFTDNCHIWATALYDEVVPLGYCESYVSFARQLRLAELRPHCSIARACRSFALIVPVEPAGYCLQVQAEPVECHGNAGMHLGVVNSAVFVDQGVSQSGGRFQSLSQIHRDYRTT